MNIQLIIFISVIILFALILFILIKLLKNSKLESLRNSIIKFITKAEALYNQGENDKKFDYVFNKAYELLPAAFRFLISEETLKNFIQLVFDGIKIALDYNAKGE